MNHLILRVVDADKRTLKNRALFIFRCEFCVLIVEWLQPICVAIELLIKHRCVFDVLLDALLIALELNYQVMINRVAAKVAHEATRLSCQMHSVDDLKWRWTIRDCQSVDKIQLHTATLWPVLNQSVMLFNVSVVADSSTLKTKRREENLKTVRWGGDVFELTFNILALPNQVPWDFVCGERFSTTGQPNDGDNERSLYLTWCAGRSIWHAATVFQICKREKTWKVNKTILRRRRGSWAFTHFQTQINCN